MQEQHSRRHSGVAGALLAGSTVLAVIATWTDLPQEPLPLTLGVVGATLVWILAFRALPPTRYQRAPSIALFVALIVLSALLVWCNPLFGFFVWTGYLFTAYMLPGWWALAGAAAVAVVTATAQIGGPALVRGAGGLLLFGTLLVLNAGISMTMTWNEIGKQRTSERRIRTIDALAQANAKLEEALKENAGLHAQLLVQAHEAGVLDERQRMAGEIHDVLAQGLTGIVTQLEAAEAQPADRERHLATAKRLARESLTEARRSVQALRPQRLDGAALPDALGEVVETWAGMHGVRADLILTGTARRLLPEIETTLLRTAQEALANVARHANAGRVGLTLSYMEDMVTLDVRDDGDGFDPARPREVTAAGGFGLDAMRERLARIAGTLEVESESGGGTALSACVPAIAIGAAA
ncbi:histidine kinase [Actinoplanes sp. SE50]|uniref:sensor histidine kinase n=1 Tax=unclassified Actinoplanes TaxID=2626549 RepID=UPI00023EBFB1|nr:MULTISPECIES: sensor histidine kinase [unclassified Actinoplanes]AEV87461.1 histidine kinase [Actinoplanes sp. SE50/110]ATO85863.1 histidine kinase [Actinoplanes sp. SE50]SLM03277.1 two-component sensor histidine kinase [Actinoplanes sp. SE50/110]